MDHAVTAVNVLDLQARVVDQQGGVDRLSVEGRDGVGRDDVPEFSEEALAALGDTLLRHDNPGTRRLAALALRREGSEQAMSYLEAAPMESETLPADLAPRPAAQWVAPVDR